MGFQILISLLCAASVTVFSYLGSAADQFSGYKSELVSGDEVYLMGPELSIIDRAELVALLQKDVVRLRAEPRLADQLTQPFGIYITNEDGPVSGVFTGELLSPGGHPAISLQARDLLSSSSRLKILTHELTHLVHHRYRPHEKIWVEEGVALLMERLITKGLHPAFKNGFNEPETSLTRLPPLHERTVSNRGEVLAGYGHLLQYFSYVYRLCGQDHLIDKLLTSTSSNRGVYFLNRTLQQMTPQSGVKVDPVCQSFDKSFIAFQRARFAPNVARDSGFVLLGREKARVRETRLKKLPPYSAQAYPVEEGDCPVGTDGVQGHYCLEVRLDTSRKYKFRF